MIFYVDSGSKKAQNEIAVIFKKTGIQGCEEVRS